MASGSGPKRGRLDAFEAFRTRLVDGYAERMVDGMSGARAGSTRSLALTRTLGILVALPVHLLSVATLVGGLYFLLLPGHTWPERILGLVLLLVSYGVRPELPKRPGYVVKLTRDSAPATFGLVQDVGALIGAPVPDEILVSTKFNAGVTRVGLRHHVLEVGAPLWVAAEPQARLALIAHEMGHLAHHDVTSGLWIGTARHTLDKWDEVFKPSRYKTHGIARRNTGLGGGTAVLLSTLVFPLFRAVVGSYSALMVWATAPASRRQELLADLDSVRVAGTDGALALFDTQLAELNVETAIASAAVDGRRPDIWNVVRERITTRGPEERSRARAGAASERTRVDASHPATTLRIRLVESRPWEPAAVVPGDAAWQAVDGELARPLASAGKALGERIRYRR